MGEFLSIGVDNYDDPVVVETILKQMDKAQGVYLTGGDQYKHARSFLKDDGKDSRLMTAIRQVHASGGFIGGNSAGDHILSDPMMGNSHSYPVLVKNAPMKITPKNYQQTADNSQMFLSTGFGFARNYGLTDSHFHARGRLGRLLVAMAHSKQYLGIGVDENAGFVVRENIGKAIGSEGVTMVSMTEAGLLDMEKGLPFTCQNIDLCFLSHGDRYDFSTHEFQTDKKEILGKGNIEGVSDFFDPFVAINLMKNFGLSGAREIESSAEAGAVSFKIILRKTADTKIYEDGNFISIAHMKMDIML